MTGEHVYNRGRISKKAADEMEWEALGAIGELGGSLLLLGSLAYVGVQIRDAKRQMVAATAQARTDSFIELFQVRCQPGFAEAELKSRKNPEALTPTEEFLLLNFLAMFLTYMNNSYYQRKAGTLEDDQSGALDSMPLLMMNEFYILSWKTRLRVGRTYSDDFVNHVDRLIEKAPHNETLNSDVE